MPVTWRASFAYLLRHPGQLVLSVLGIAIGVAVIVAVDLANDSSRKAFLMSMDAVTGTATHQVIGGPRGVDEQVYVQLRTEQGFDAIAPIVEGEVLLDGVRLNVLGVDLFAEQGIRDFTWESADDTQEDSTLFEDFLTRPGAASVARETAAVLGLEPGDDFTVESGGKTFSGDLLIVRTKKALYGIRDL